MIELRNYTYTTKELLAVAASLDIPLDESRLKMWVQRGVISAEQPGRGRDRRWPLGELISVLCLAFIAQRIPRLPGQPKSGMTVIEFLPTVLFSNRVAFLFEHDFEGWEHEPLRVLSSNTGSVAIETVEDMSARQLAGIYATRGAMLLHAGQFAIDLAARLFDVIQERPRG